MSRIDDDGSDLRTRELTEAQLLRKQTDEKKSSESRLEKSFQQVMSERGKRDGEKSGQEQTAAKGKSASHEALNKLKKEQPKTGADLARRAALSRAMQGGLAAKRTQEHANANQVAETRGEELRNKAADEGERIEKDSKEIEERGERVVDEKQADVKKDARFDPVERQTGDRERRGGQDRQQDERRSEAIQASNAPKAHVVQIPRELIEKLVSAIHTAVNADGRTSMVVTLKGGKLEGVRLNISAEHGKVSCEIEGCDQETGKLLKGGKEALKGALAKRGLSLVKLEVK